MSTEEGSQAIGGEIIATETKAPVVFVSYSHDSPEHKEWVLNLAGRLRAERLVDVRIDEWDLGAGDDVPKFMERAVSEADRVLMICTEPYVRKADAGEGGVGYEAMIVTAELVKNLGTAKFVPVIRQTSQPRVRPKSVETRKYVDLSADRNLEAGLEELAMELHNARKFMKPPLGGVGWKPEAKSELAVAAVKFEDAESAYLTGCAVARSGDLKTWRELVRKVKEPLSGRLNEWRKKFDGAHSMQVDALPGMVLEAATIYSPLMAVALAGVESGNRQFSNQVAMLDEFLRPRNWNSAGLVVVGSVPDALVFTYQALHGAACLEIGEIQLAVALSRARVARAHEHAGQVVHDDHNFMALPQSLHAFKQGWNYLKGLRGKWSWLAPLFPTEEEYQAALCAYYMALSIQELAGLLSRGEVEVLIQERIQLQTPVEWMAAPSEIQHKAYRLLTQNPDSLRWIWRSLGVDDAAMAASWPRWMHHTKVWAEMVNTMRYLMKPVLGTLFEDVRPEGIKP